MHFDFFAQFHQVQTFEPSLSIRQVHGQSKRRRLLIIIEGIFIAKQGITYLISLETFFKTRKELQRRSVTITWNQNSLLKQKCFSSAEYLPHSLSALFSFSPRVAFYLFLMTVALCASSTYMVVVETSCFPTFNSLFPAQAVLQHLSCGRLLPKQSQGNVFSMGSAWLQCPLALALLLINCLLQVMRGNWLTAPRLVFPLIFCRDQSDSSRSPAKVTRWVGFSAEEDNFSRKV